MNFYMVITKVLVHFCPPPPYKFLSPLDISFSLSLSLSLSLSQPVTLYLFLYHLVSDNRIEARQWIVAQHLSCYNPPSCFTPFCGVKYDQIKFHEFFCVCNFFSFSPVTPSLSPLSLYLSLSHPCLSTYLSLPLLSLSFSLPSLSLFFFSRSCLSFHLSLSHPCCLPLLLPLMSPCLPFTLVSPSPSLWLSLPLFHPCLSSYLPLSHRCLIFYILLSLSLSPSKEREHKIIL